MAILIKNDVCEYFALCYGFMGPHESFDMILRGDGIANEWVYNLIAPLDSDNQETVSFNNYVHKNNIQKEKFKVHNKGLQSYRKYFGNKVTSKIGNCLTYYVAFNPIPYTAEHDLYIIENSCVLPASDKLRFIIPYVGECFANDKLIGERLVGIIETEKDVSIRIENSFSAIAIVTRL